MNTDDPKDKIKQLFEKTQEKQKDGKAVGSYQSSTFTGDSNIIVYGNFTQHAQPAPVQKVVVKVRPGSEHISSEQKVILKKLVDEVVATEAKLRKSPRSYPLVWKALNNHCKVETYHLIAAGDFKKARTYLNSWLARLNSSRSAPVKNGDDWRRRRYSYIKVNLKVSEDKLALDRYLEKNFGTKSLRELDNNELEWAYRYIAGRISRKK